MLYRELTVLALLTMYPGCGPSSLPRVEDRIPFDSTLEVITEVSHTGGEARAGDTADLLEDGEVRTDFSADAEDTQHSGEDGTAEPIPPSAASLDPWGGIVGLQVHEGTGRFSTGVHEGRAFVVTPDGNAFLSFGMQAVGFGNLSSPALGYAPGTLAQQALAAEHPGPTRKVIEEQILDLLVDNGFNTVGGWSGGFTGTASGRMPYTLSLGFAGAVQGKDMTDRVPPVSAGGFPDVFHPAFAANCLRYAQSSLSSSLADDPWLIGVYSDNEQRWHGGNYLLAASDHTLTDDFLDEDSASPGKQTLVAWFRDRYSDDIGAFNDVYGTQLVSFDGLADVTSLPLSSSVPRHMEDRLGFMEPIAEAYYRGVFDALRTVAPAVLFLCDRIASVASLPVWRQAGRYCDVVTINDYYTRHDQLIDWGMGGVAEDRWESFLSAVWEGAQGPRPLWVTEWGLRATDSGLPNTFGAGFVDPSQQDRGEYYSHFTQWFLEREIQGIRYATGWHWFMYMDEPPTGRFDGEDGNYGIVTVRSEPYLFLLRAMSSVHRRWLSFLKTRIMPTLLLPPSRVDVSLDASGQALVLWGSVPHAEAYRLWVSHHPASVSRHLVASWETPETSMSVPLSLYGEGTFWFAVEPLHSSLLTLGARFSPPVQGPGLISSSGPSLEDVLACDTLETVRFHNQLSFPNTLWGQSYAVLEGGLTDGSPRAIRFDLVPSSLGWAGSGASESPEITAELGFPQPIFGSTLHCLVKTNHVKPIQGEVGCATRFLSLRFRDSQGEILGTRTLDLPHIVAGVPASVEIALPEAPISELQIVLDLSQQGLPMEQRFSVTLDQLIVHDGDEDRGVTGASPPYPTKPANPHETWSQRGDLNP